LHTHTHSSQHIPNSPEQNTVDIEALLTLEKKAHK